jgi:hypothetical protein
MANRRKRDRGHRVQKNNRAASADPIEPPDPLGKRRGDSFARLEAGFSAQLEAFRRIEPRHRSSLRELAK